MFSRFWLRGQRRGDSRKAFGSREYVDRYTRSEYVVVIGILVLSAIDAVMTLRYLAHGGEEANPVMLWALDQGVGWFISLKMGYTLVAAAFLLMHARFPLARFLTWILLALYIGLTGYHVYICARIPVL